jgi:hypothetical protein
MAHHHAMYLSVTGQMETIQTGESIAQELWSEHQDPQTLIPWISLSGDISNHQIIQ